MKFTREEIAKALKLYVITDRSWLKEDETLLSVCEKVIQNGATFLQLREKELNAEETRKEAIELQKLCRSYKIPFVVNDSVEIAMEMDADGVHVGQSDIKDRDIRAILGPDKILGIQQNGGAGSGCRKSRSRLYRDRSVFEVRPKKMQRIFL